MIEPATHELAPGIAEICASYPEIAAAYLFGSRARGDARPDSDLDVGLVLRRRGETAELHHRWLRDLAGRLEALCPGSRVDVVLLEPQGPIFAHRVLCEGVRAYEADRVRRVDFESDTISRALDLLPAHERLARERIHGFRRWLRSRSA